MIYDNIVELAQKKGLSLRKIEKEAGLPNGIISKWKTANPRVDNLIAVADVLKVPISTLTKGK